MLCAGHDACTSSLVRQGQRCGDTGEAAGYHQHDGLGLEERRALGQVGEVDVPALLGKLRANVGGDVRALDH